MLKSSPEFLGALSGKEVVTDYKLNYRFNSRHACLVTLNVHGFGVGGFSGHILRVQAADIFASSFSLYNYVVRKDEVQEIGLYYSNHHKVHIKRTQILGS